MSNKLTPEQQLQAEKVFQEALSEWTLNGSVNGDMQRFFFYAGAQLGIQLTQQIYKETIDETTSL